nr:DUF2182 domain-containing protein [uncultured Dongia sp.]
MSIDFRPGITAALPSYLARSGTALGWILFYLLLALSWTGLIWLTAAPEQMSTWRALLDRCLAPAETLAFAPRLGMWALMSLGMMLPTTLPALQRFADLVQNRRDGQAFYRFLSFLSAYVLIWLGFSVLAAGTQTVLARVEWAGADNFLPTALFGFAGLYQFSRLKHACLTRCRHPMTFFMAHWQDGKGGAFHMGLRHGRDCLGCCWALMALGFVGGAMSLGWMGLGMVLMVLEKLAGPGRYVTLPLGLVLISAAGFALGTAWQGI